ncbi:MAG: preprotein translocase subunit SecA [Candidatus Binatia bacterium]|nr:preprotein translocase subunit SecA [Candidatus Binatia bacterium]
MLGGLVRKVFGTKNDRELKRLQPLVHEISNLEPEIEALSDDGLRARTAGFKEQLEQGADVDDLLVPAFAVAREGAKRALGMRPFDVQLVGGMVLHHGRIAEMRTGEGKTLVATLPVYLNALTGKGVHVVTVNDYLASRDAEWMGRMYNFLGLSWGVVVHGIDDQTRRNAYQADITYGQNNEFGFDYLRDNMKFSLEDYVQRDLNFAIVDEVDSILVDEARTPLIISGPSEDSTDRYAVINQIVPKLKQGKTTEKGEAEDGDFAIDEKMKQVILTEQGVARSEELLNIDNLYDTSQIDTLHHLTQSLRAHSLFHLDTDYVVKEGEVIIVDEFTGRMMEGRRWSDGLHQAIEAKEGVKIERENQTLATVTFQNYFRMYDKLAGMTGTADTEAIEFKKIYDLDVMVVPTHRDMVRKDHPDVVYKTEPEKFEAVIDEIEECRETGQPVLVGTITIDKSERLSALLKRRGVKHHVLNAKAHGREAEIVAQAGRLGAVTISTNMAGRGTDIVLGGNAEAMAVAQIGRRDPEDPEFKEAIAKHEAEFEGEREQVLEAGGLHIVGTERHESRRIDNQLRGRSGRQGDPGSSRFFLSLEDDLLRIFGAERIQGLMTRLGMEEGEPIEHKMLTRAIQNAQTKVEGHNFDMRKHLLEYDDVMNKQREVVYNKRLETLGGEHLSEEVHELTADVAQGVIDTAVDTAVVSTEWEWDAIGTGVLERFGLHFDVAEEEREGLLPEDLQERIMEAVKAVYAAREEQFTPEVMRHLERVVLLRTIDQQWKDHLLNMDRLKEGVGLRGYGQQNPLQAYQKEGFAMFNEMMDRIHTEAVRSLFTVQVKQEQDLEDMEERRPKQQGVTLSHGAVSEAAAAQTPVRNDGDKTGRNDPCPCGSGKKFKKCHGR